MSDAHAPERTSRSFPRLRLPESTAYDASRTWGISLYPDGYRFAFTIVHDADTAYSRRLAPLFDVFDELGFKITATVFTFWAAWAYNGAIWQRWNAAESGRHRLLAPKAVPLADDSERDFYRQLAARGHEIGMHAASETSDTRVELARAFEYFREVFGGPPTVYVEHSRNNNKDAQTNEGALVHSPYYNTDLLNQQGAWVWVDCPEGLRDPASTDFYDLLAANGSPFNRHVAERYGIQKGFVRTGRWGEADGDGFLRWYSEENIDALHDAGGLALVYMHLDAGWLDPQTWRMKTAIEQRLKYLASKGGWYAPAGSILDRIAAVNALAVSWDGQELCIANRSGQKIEGLTVLSSPGRSLSRGSQVFKQGPDGEMVVGEIQPDEALLFRTHS